MIVVIELEELRAMIREELRAARGAAPADGLDLVSARTSGIGVTTFDRERRRGSFPAIKVGRCWMARRSDVIAWLESKAQSATKPKDVEAPAPIDPLERALASGQLRVIGTPRRSSR